MESIFNDIFNLSITKLNKPVSKYERFLLKEVLSTKSNTL